MRNIWVAIIGVLTISLFAGTSFATAPIVQDIPDFKLLTGSGAVNDFDLSGYVTDYDDPVNTLTWSIQGYTGFDGGANPASLAGSLLDIAGKSSPTQGVVTFRVADASEHADDTSTVKYASLMLVGPGLTQDNNLYPEDSFVRTWVIEGENFITTPVIADLITPQSASGANLYVSIADMDGNWLAGDNATSAEVAQLAAAITGDGKLSLSAPAGSYPITGTAFLANAYRVGIKAKLTGGGIAAGENWDGMELLASHARFPTYNDVPSAADLDKFDNFEGVATGALAGSIQAMRLLGANNPRWYMPISSDATALIAASAPTSVTTAWASSGQALDITLNSSTSSVFILSERFTDILPGENLTFQANVTTTADAAAVPNMYMFMGNFEMPSCYEGLCLQQGNGLGSPQIPLGGDSGWRTMKASFTADTFGFSIPDGTETVNFHEKGIQCAFAITGTAGATFPLHVYIDNVRVYRDKSDADKALAATSIAVVQNATQTTFFDGEFEGGTTFAALGWQGYTGYLQGVGEIDTSGANNMFTHDGDNSLMIYMNSAVGRSAAQTHYVYARVELNATPAGGLNNRGDGLIGCSMWLKSDGAAVKDLPGVFIGMADLNFRNIPFADVGYVGLPMVGQGWKKVDFGSARYNAAKLMVFIAVRADYPLLTTRGYWGSYQQEENRPGKESDARVYFDDVQLHKVQDDVTYFDRSVFPATD